MTQPQPIIGKPRGKSIMKKTLKDSETDRKTEQALNKLSNEGMSDEQVQALRDQLEQRKQNKGIM